MDIGNAVAIIVLSVIQHVSILHLFYLRHNVIQIALGPVETHPAKGLVGRDAGRECAAKVAQRSAKDHHRYVFRQPRVEDVAPLPEAAHTWATCHEDANGHHKTRLENTNRFGCLSTFCLLC